MALLYDDAMTLGNGFRAAGTFPNGPLDLAGRADRPRPSHIKDIARCHIAVG
jgi:hypothetical protein